MGFTVQSESTHIKQLNMCLIYCLEEVLSSFKVSAGGLKGIWEKACHRERPKGQVECGGGGDVVEGGEGHSTQVERM